MTHARVEHLEEEPQHERGAPGSRDTGADVHEGGPASRPAEPSGPRSDTSVDPQNSITGGPYLQAP